MAELTQQQVVDYIKDISVLELCQLVKRSSPELGVSAAAALPMALPAAAGRRRGGPGRGEDRVQRRPSPKSARTRLTSSRSSAKSPPGLEGSQGPRRSAPKRSRKA